MIGGGICLQKQLLDSLELFGGEFGEECVSLHKFPEDVLLIGDGRGYVVKMAL